MSDIFISRHEGESWRDCVGRVAEKFGLDRAAVQAAYDREVEEDEFEEGEDALECMGPAFSALLDFGIDMGARKVSLIYSLERLEYESWRDCLLRYLSERSPKGLNEGLSHFEHFVRSDEKEGKEADPSGAAVCAAVSEDAADIDWSDSDET